MFAEFSMGCQQLFEHFRAAIETTTKPQNKQETNKQKTPPITKKVRKEKTTSQAEGKAVRAEQSQPSKGAPEQLQITKNEV